MPLIVGLSETCPDHDQLKAFCAGFGTTAAAAMFHIQGVTPEAQQWSCLSELEVIRLKINELETVWSQLDGNSEFEESIQLVALGNPHLSLSEFKSLAELCNATPARAHPDVSVVITAGRQVVEEAEQAGYIKPIREFGATLVSDTCWCMLTEPVVPIDCDTLVTNSAKYAHYAPGLVNKRVRFSSMAGCIAAAQSGIVPKRGARPWESRPYSTCRAEPRGVDHAKHILRKVRGFVRLIR